MILGINTTQPSVTYVTLSSDGGTVHHWDSDGSIESLPVRIQAALTTGAPLKGVLVITGPGRYTGIRVGVTMAKMISMVHGVPAMGVSLFDAQAQCSVYPSLRVLTSPSRKGWLNLQLFQSNSRSVAAISSIQQIELSAMDAWFASFRMPIRWEHIGAITGSFIVSPIQVTLDMMAVTRHYQSHIVDSQLGPLVPLYSYPAV